jgi:hypothetical protein
LIETFTGPQFGFTKLKAAQIVRWLVEKEGKLIPVEDSGLVSFTLNRNISEYEARQQKLQEVYLRNEGEGKILDVLERERKEIEAAAKLEADTIRFNNNRKMWRKKKEKQQGIGGGKRTK